LEKWECFEEIIKTIMNPLVSMRDIELKLPHKGIFKRQRLWLQKRSREPEV